MTQSQSYSVNTDTSKKNNNLLLVNKTGERLKELRENRGINQRQFGEILGYTQQAISIKESGERQISSCEIVRFSQALRLSVDEILYLLFGVKSE